jgi:hypothetical protein
MTAPAFGRPSLFVASREGTVAQVLSRFIRLFLSEDLPHYFPEENIVVAGCAEDICAQLDNMGQRELLDTVCIVDLPHDQSVTWNIGEYEEGLRASELLLRYPEVYWIFIILGTHKTETWCRLPGEARKHHFVTLEEPDGLGKIVELLRRHSNGFRAWFDPTGLRRALRGEEDQRVHGAAIDDEVEFAVMNSYVLYRNHCPTYILNSLAEMKNVLGNGLDGSWSVLEDLELNFFDLPQKHLWESYLGTFVKQSDGSPTPVEKVIRTRKETFKCLQTANRIFVSSVPKAVSGHPCILKPYGGVYAEELKAIQIPIKQVSAITTHLGGHPVGSARAQRLAENLIERAQNLEPDAKTAVAAIHAALLAMDARRLLRGGALTLSLDALAIQHRMEVTAECSFIGTASKLNTGERLRDIKDEIERIVKCKYQVNNAMVEIVDQLRRIYREFDQFMEEEEALKSVRCYEWKLKYWSPLPASGIKLISSGMKSPVKLALGIPEAYFLLLMRGFGWIVLSVIIWIAVFAYGYWCLEKMGKVCGYGLGYEGWFFHSAATFLALQQGIAGDPGIEQAGRSLTLVGESGFVWFWVISIAEMAFGFVHIGIFVSYLFQKISRR